MENPRITTIEGGTLVGKRPREAGCNAPSLDPRFERQRSPRPHHDRRWCNWFWRVSHNACRGRSTFGRTPQTTC